METRFRNLLIGCLFIIIFATYTVACIFYVDKIELKYLLAIGVLIEIFYFVPVADIKYHRLYNQNLGNKTFLAFIPHVNYVLCMNKAFFILSNAIFALIVAVVLLIAFPSWLNIMPNKIVFLFSDYMVNVTVVLVILYNTVVGLGLYILSIDVNKIYTKHFPRLNSKGVYHLVEILYRLIPFLDLVLYIVPVARSISLTQLNDKMITLSKCGIDAYTDLEEED